jgi:hypothetical protein
MWSSKSTADGRHSSSVAEPRAGCIVTTTESLSSPVERDPCRPSALVGQNELAHDLAGRRCRLRPHLRCRARLDGPRTFALAHLQTPLQRVGATARRHHANPAEAHWRWRGRGASRSGSVSVTTMHALSKGEVERKMTSGSTGFLRCASRSLNSPTVMLLGLPCEQRLAKSLQLNIRQTAAQTRISRRPRQGITVLQIDSSHTDSAVRVRYAQPGSPVSTGHRSPSSFPGKITLSRSCRSAGLRSAAGPGSPPSRCA